MVVIKTQKVPHKESSPDQLLAIFCYNFPQYTFNAAKKLPYRRIIQMITVARQEQAKVLYNITRAIAAPHSKEKGTVNKLLSELKEIIEK